MSELEFQARDVQWRLDCALRRLDECDDATLRATAPGQHIRELAKGVADLTTRNGVLWEERDRALDRCADLSQMLAHVTRERDEWRSLCEEMTRP